LGLGHQFIKYQRTSQTLSLPSILARSSDGLPITLDISTQFTLPVTRGKELRQLYYYFEQAHESAMLELIDGVVRDVSANFTSYQFFQNRTLLGSAMEITLRSYFANLFISIDAFQIVNVLLPAAFTQEIENTAIAIQESQRALNERQVALVNLQTRNGTIRADIDIAILNRETQVFNVLQSANNTAASIINLYSTEASALASVKDELGLTNDELLAYIFVKSLQNVAGNVRLSVGVNPKLI